MRGGLGIDQSLMKVLHVFFFSVFAKLWSQVQIIVHTNEDKFKSTHLKKYPFSCQRKPKRAIFETEVQIYLPFIIPGKMAIQRVSQRRGRVTDLRQAMVGTLTLALTLIH